jgi:rare lipoprotein A
MRSIIAVAAFASAAVMAGAVPASASWTCEGPAYVCGSSGPSQASHQTYKTKVHYRAPNGASKLRVAYKPSPRHYAEAPARQRRSHVASYDNGGGGNYSGMASYYWEGQTTASGARFNPGAMTAAHRSLPFGTRVLVTNQRNGQSVVVTINDRGPFVGGRVIDLSRAAAQAINMTGAGVAPVSLQVLGRG